MADYINYSDDDPRTELVRLGSVVIRPALVAWVELHRHAYGRPGGVVTIHLRQAADWHAVDLEGDDAEAARRYFMAPEVAAP